MFNSSLDHRLALLLGTTAIVLTSIGCRSHATLSTTTNGSNIILHLDAPSTTPLNTFDLWIANQPSAPVYSVQGSLHFAHSDFTLHSGPSPISTFEVANSSFHVTPTASNITTFTLQPNQPYTAKVCIANDCRTTSFILHQ
jgi:hypothetical protein